jgi:hypothetical protein
MEVKMWFRAVAAIAAQADHLTLANVIAYAHHGSSRRQMNVCGNRPVGVLDVDVVLLAGSASAVCEARLDEKDLPGTSSNDLGSDRHQEVVSELHDRPTSVRSGSAVALAYDERPSDVIWQHVR